MNLEPNLDQPLDLWFDEQTTAPSPDLLPRAIARAGRVRQRPGFLTRDWYGASAPIPGGRILVPAVTVVIVLVAAAALTATSGILTQPRLPAVANTKAVFAPSAEVAFRAVLRSDGTIPQFNWRAGAYSEYSGAGWSSGNVTGVPVAAGQPLAVFGDAERPGRPENLAIEIVVTPDALDGPAVMGPRTIASIDLPVEAVAVGPERWYASIERTGGGSGQYVVSALLPTPDNRPGGLNEATLRGAGIDYSPSMLAIYTQLPDDAVGPAALALLNEIRAAVPGAGGNVSAYDLARTMERYLTDPTKFEYDPDVRPDVTERCQGLSTAECLAIIRRGYCEYYATTMAVLLRQSGIPTRIAYGFLAGSRDEDDVEVVGGWLAHWWVEVYFPGVGWFEFDPTPSVGRPYPLPAGT